MSFWKAKSVLVTGGASFIGSHLVDRLVALDAKVRVVDNLSSGDITNIEHQLKTRAIQFIEGNLLDREIVRAALQDVGVVIHLAADHGGRGYVDLKQVECASNLMLDSLVIQESHRMGVQKFVFASSGCVYPNYIQTDPKEEK